MDKQPLLGKAVAPARHGILCRCPNEVSGSLLIASSENDRCIGCRRHILLESLPTCIRRVNSQHLSRDFQIGGAACAMRRISSLILLLSMSGAPLRAQSVSDQLRSRTGYTLPDAPREGPAVFALPPGVTFSGSLTSGDAVTIALWNNASLQADLAGLEVTRADLVEAGQFRNPNFSTLFPVGPKPFEFLLTWPIEELWHRGKRIKAAELNVNAVATSLVQNGLNLIRDVRVAHAELWLAQQRARILQESVELRTRIATLTERRRDAGDGTGLDVRIAQVGVQSLAELSRYAAAETDVRRSSLRLLLGMRGDSRPIEAVIERRTPPALPAVSALLETAVSNRPDLRAAEMNVQTAAERAKWERSQVLALLAPTLSVKEVGTDGLRAGPGLNMEIPILSRNQGRISRADAEVIRAGREYVSLRDRVEREVLEARARMLQALESVQGIATQVRPPIDDSIQLVQRAFQNGDVSFLNVLEVTRQRYDVDLREVEMAAAAERARAEMERALGRGL